MMHPDQPRKLQFLSNNLPGKPISATEQRRAHSHAARAAHARNRRLCTLEHQAQKSTEVSKLASDAADRNIATTHSFETIIPSPVNLLASDRRDPFDSFVRSFTPVEHFLLDYYVTVVLPYMDRNCNDGRMESSSIYLDLMAKEWVRLTLTNLGSLSAVFLCASRHLQQHQHHEELYYKKLAIHYKLLGVRALREAICLETSLQISNSSFVLGVLLAYDEVQIGNITMTRHHLRGMVQMVEHNGGARSLRTNGFIGRIVGKFIGEYKTYDLPELLEAARLMKMRHT